MALVLLCAPAPALAKDVCVQLDLDNRIVFRNIKSLKTLKKPGMVVPLNGIYAKGSAFAGSVSGTAYVAGDGGAPDGPASWGAFDCKSVALP